MSDPDVLALFEKNYGVKRTTLSHLTKQKYGKTAFQLYNDKRFEYALGLLIEGRNTITDIAQKCAFSSVASFSKAFTQYFGMSPSRYLQTHVSQNTDERHIDIYADFSTCAFWHSGAEFSEKYFQTTSNTTEYQNPKLNLI